MPPSNVAVRVILSRYAACGSVRAADSSRGMAAGDLGAGVVSRYAAHMDDAGTAATHAPRGIAGGKGGTHIRITCHATGSSRTLNCEQEAESADQPPSCAPVTKQMIYSAGARSEGGGLCGLAGGRARVEAQCKQ